MRIFRLRSFVDIDNRLLDCRWNFVGIVDETVDQVHALAVSALCCLIAQQAQVAITDELEGAEAAFNRFDCGEADATDYTTCDLDAAITQAVAFSIGVVVAVRVVPAVLVCAPGDGQVGFPFLRVSAYDSIF